MKEDKRKKNGKSRKKMLEVSKGGHQGASSITLALVEPQNTADLVHQGDNLFRSLSDTTPVSPNARNVMSGFLELSGVRPTSEMMEMIEASRAFESNVRLIQSQDDMVGQLLSRVLRQS